MTLVDLLHVVLLLGAATSLFAGLRLLQQRYRLAPELVRKMFHVGGGILGLTLPWLFDSIVPVIVLAVAIAGGFVAIRRIATLRAGVGQVLHAVQRDSVGEFCYVASLVLLFWLARGDKLLYSIPLLILALADTFAALIGEQYGRLLLRQEGVGKSYEGVAAFFLTAFFCIHVPVLLAERTGRLESLLVAAGVSVMVMMAEAAAWWGLDNLIIPLFSYMLLKSMLGRDAAVLAADIAFFLALALFMRMWRRRTPLADDALFGATLVAYVIWSVGGWQWALAPLAQLGLYALLVRATPTERRHIHRFPVILAHVAGSAFWLLLFAQSREPSLLLPFSTCYGVNVAIMALLRLKAHVPSISAREAISVATAKGLLVVLLPVLAQSGLTIAAALDFAGCSVAVYAATALFYRLQPNLAEEPLDAPRWIRQMAIGATTSAIAIGLHYSAVPRPDLATLIP
jgi:phytol kinase